MITLLAFCRHNTSCGEVSDVGEEGENDISVEITAGVAVFLSLLVVLPVGVALGCCGMWYLMKREKDHHFKVETRQDSQYAQPFPPQSAIPVTSNQAYASAGNQNMYIHSSLAASYTV